MKNEKNSIFLIRQCLILFIALSLLLILYEVLGGVTVTSLGASGFIIFTMPHKSISKTTNMVFAYLFASIVGIIFGITYGMLHSLEILWLPSILIVFKGLSVTITVYVMVRTKYAHPPAAALALGLVSDPQRIYVAMIAILGTFVLCLIRKCLSKHLHDLM